MTTKTIYRISHPATGAMLGAWAGHHAFDAWRLSCHIAGFDPGQGYGHLKIEGVDEAMREFNRSVTPGSESNAWQDYQADLHALDTTDPAVAQRHADYWLKVAAGESDDYDSETGSRTE